MRKLQLDELHVETFETSLEPVERGTVHAHAATDPPQCWTDEVSCGGSCYNTNCGNHTCQHNCTGGASCGGSCNCPTWDITCEPTTPDPWGTCCHYAC
jgi:hypothetical protein